MYERMWSFNENLSKHATIRNPVFIPSSEYGPHSCGFYSYFQPSAMNQGGLGSITGNNRKQGSKRKSGANVLLTRSRFGRQWQGTFRNSAAQVPRYAKSPVRGALKTEGRGATWSVSPLCVRWAAFVTRFMKGAPTHVTLSCFSIKCYSFTEQPSWCWLTQQKINLMSSWTAKSQV